MKHIPGRTNGRYLPYSVSKRTNRLKRRNDYKTDGDYATYEDQIDYNSKGNKLSKSILSAPYLSNRQKWEITQDMLDPQQQLTAFSQAIDEIPDFKPLTVMMYRRGRKKDENYVRRFQYAIANANEEENKYNTAYGNMINTEAENDWIMDPRTYQTALRIYSNDGDSYRPGGIPTTIHPSTTESFARGFGGTSTLYPVGYHTL